LKIKKINFTNNQRKIVIKKASKNSYYTNGKVSFFRKKNNN